MSNTIPTSAGSSKAVAEVLPELNGELTGMIVQVSGIFVKITV